MGKAEQIVLRPAEQWRDEQAREVEVVERLDREAHRREQILHRARLRQRKSIDPSDRHMPRLQPRDDPRRKVAAAARTEEHTSELPSTMRSSYAVFSSKRQTSTTPDYSN